MINEPMQKTMITLGDFGCYFLSILRAAELKVNKNIDLIAAYYESIYNGWIGKECFLNNPEKIIGYLLGGDWTVTKETPDYEPKDGEIVILRYERPIATGTSSHFVLGDKAKKVVYDPMGVSQTVLYGKLMSLRILRRV